MSNAHDETIIHAHNIVTKYLNPKSLSKQHAFTNGQLLAVVNGACQHFATEPTLLHIKTPIYIVGDLHGQYTDLHLALTHNGLPPSKKILVLGDMVDRGPRSLTVVACLFALKCLYPNQIFLLRGNHEHDDTNREHGFYDEVMNHKHLSSEPDEIYNACQQAFDHMPLAAVLDDDIFCVHGGLSPFLDRLDRINAIHRPIHDFDQHTRENAKQMLLATDILWADPCTNCYHPKDVDYHVNPRGISCCFTKRATATVMKRCNLSLVIRAHTYAGGKGFRADHDGQVLTIFSASDYIPGVKSNGAVIHVDVNHNMRVKQHNARCRN